MKKIFLTSGIVLCMACPAFAENPTVYDINTDNTLVGTGDPTNNVPADPATCQYPTIATYENSQTFHAKWQANDYSVTYVTNTHGGGAGSTDSGVTFNTDNYTIKGIGDAGVTEDTGYHFVNWSAVSAGTNVDEAWNTAHQNQTYTPGNSFNPYAIAGDLRLTANFTWNTSTITLDSSMYPGNAHGGTATYNTANGVNASTPSPIYGAYDHGFYNSTANAVLGGTGEGSGQLSGVSVPTLTGYTFNGFFANANDENPVITAAGAFAEDAEKVVSGNGATATWYAHWSPIQYTLTYSCGSYTGTYNNQPFTRTSTDTIDAVNINYDANIATAIADPSTECTLDGYHINASNPWTCVIHDHTTHAALTGEGSTVAYSTLAGTGTTWKVANDVTCTANWLPNDITLTWNPGDGATATANGGAYAAGSGANTCTYDLGITVGAAPFKKGYTFKGWTTDATDPQVIETTLP